ncbi:hypothetical protein GCM10029964_088080 [Kibdelosporangium lantanae]
MGAGDVRFHLLGWVLAGWVPMTCLMVHGLIYRRRYKRPNFTTARADNVWPTLVAIAGVVVSAWHGYDLAPWLVSR